MTNNTRTGTQQAVSADVLLPMDIRQVRITNSF